MTTTIQPWTNDPEEDRRFMEAVHRIDRALQHPPPTWRQRQRKRITVHRKPARTILPASNGRHVRARHAARGRIPMWCLLVALAANVIALLVVLL